MSKDVLLPVTVVVTALLIMLFGLLEEKLRYTNYKHFSMIACFVSVLAAWLVILNFEWIYNVACSW